MIVRAARALSRDENRGESRIAIDRSPAHLLTIGCARMARRARTQGMIYLRVEAMPNQAMVDIDGVAGAFINCWIPTDDLAHAEATARDWIEREGWVIVAVEEFRPIPLADQRGGPDAKYIRKARQHGGTVVFHKWFAAGEPAVG